MVMSTETPQQAYDRLKALLKSQKEARAGIPARAYATVAQAAADRIKAAQAKYGVTEGLPINWQPPTQGGQGVHNPPDGYPVAGQQIQVKTDDIDTAAIGMCVNMTSSSPAWMFCKRYDLNQDGKVDLIDELKLSSGIKATVTAVRYDNTLGWLIDVRYLTGGRSTITIGQIAKFTWTY